MSFQIVSPDELKCKLQNCGHWAKMDAGKYKAVIETDDPSKKFKGGRSFIISYYDQNSMYVCTIHRMTDRKGTVKHEHPKHAVIGSVEYDTG